MPEKELEAVLHAVSRFPESASIDQLTGSFEHAIPRRTLQCRVALLVSERRLSAEGMGRGCRYRLPTTPNEAKTRMSAPGSLMHSICPLGFGRIFRPWARFRAKVCPRERMCIRFSASSGSSIDQ